MLREAVVPEKDMCLTVRHAIMQVNYRVRIRAVSEGDIDAVTIPAASGAGFRWARRREWR